LNDRPAPAPGTQHDDDADRWREAARLRRDHHGWAVIWLAPAGEFRAYRRPPGARRDTALAAATASGLAAQISQAEQPSSAQRGLRQPRSTP
jgi:hypothetical protein